MSAVKSLGYRRHEELADLLGRKRYASGYRCNVAVVLDDGREAVLVDSSNAGFRGIEGRFEIDGDVVHLDLGHIAEWVA